MVRARTDSQRGGVLLVVAGVILVISLSVFAVFAMRHAQRRAGIDASTPARLARIDTALANFVAINRRLPCPAPGALASGAAGAGVESINLGSGACVPATQINGVLPWATLGLTEDAALDAWNGRISYRVQPSLASNLLLLANMSWCDPAGTVNGTSGAALACTAPCVGAACKHPLNYLYGKGLQVQNGSGGWLNQPAPPWPGAPVPPPPAATGAAYVLVSHGANGFGAFNRNGVLQAFPAVPSANEMANRNGVALTGATIFIDAPLNGTAAASYFDDILSHPAIATVLGNAQLGARTPH